MKKYTFKLTGGEAQSFGIVGDYVHMSSLIGDVTIKTDNSDVVVLSQAVGWKSVKLFTYLSMEVDNTQTVSFYAGTGQVFDGRTVIIEAVDISAGETISGINVTLPPNTLTQLFTGDLARKSVIMQNIGPTQLMIGGSDLTLTTNGLLIQPFDSVTITQGAKIPWYGICDSANGDSTINGMGII